MCPARLCLPAPASLHALSSFKAKEDFPPFSKTVHSYLCAGRNQKGSQGLRSVSQPYRPPGGAGREEPRHDAGAAAKPQTRRMGWLWGSLPPPPGTRDPAFCTPPAPKRGVSGSSAPHWGFTPQKKPQLCTPKCAHSRKRSSKPPSAGPVKMHQVQGFAESC